MRKATILLLALCASLTTWAIEMPKAGPQYMPEVMEPIVAPFDVSGIHLPVFAQRTTVVKMARNGLSTDAIQTAIDRMSQKGGGTVVIPDGEWTSGRIILKSGVRLHLSDGAVLQFSGDIKDYQPAVLTRNEGYDVMSLGAMIYANGAENIGITGRSHIVGPSTECEMYVKNRDYLVAGITIDQGLFWNIVPQYCDNIIIRGVTVNSAGHGRTDGIDIESTTNSLIEYCSLDCGDCYTIKSGRGEDGVKIGRPSVGVVIHHSVALRGGGSHDVWVERVYAKDITYNAFTVDMLGSQKWVGELANRFPARPVNELTPEFKNIYIRDITVDGCARFIGVKALPERPLTNVLIENADVRCKDFMNMQDAEGFVLHNATIRTGQPTATLDGCHSVMLLDVDFQGKQLKQSLKNATLQVNGSDSAAAPTPQLEFVMQLRVTLGQPYSVGDTPHGRRNVVPITGGTFEGPRLKGTILNGGADYQLSSADGSRTELEAIYSIQADDGTYIHVRNRGIISNGQDEQGHPSFYFKAAPQFEAPAGSAHAWLNNAIYVCQPEWDPQFKGIVLNVWMVK